MRPSVRIEAPLLRLELDVMNEPIGQGPFPEQADGDDRKKQMS
jgi:hypothetical protein